MRRSVGIRKRRSEGSRRGQQSHSSHCRTSGGQEPPADHDGTPVTRYAVAGAERPEVELDHQNCARARPPPTGRAVPSRPTSRADETARPAERERGTSRNRRHQRTRTVECTGVIPCPSPERAPNRNSIKPLSWPYTGRGPILGLGRIQPTLSLTGGCPWSPTCAWATRPAWRCIAEETTCSFTCARSTSRFEAPVMASSVGQQREYVQSSATSRRRQLQAARRR